MRANTFRHFFFRVSAGSLLAASVGWLSAASPGHVDGEAAAVRRKVEQFTLPASRVAVALAHHDYLFAYFKGNGEDGMHLAHSEDGLTWRALKHDSAFFKPTVGAEKLTRDPSIVRGSDGTYHMVWTAG